jgi:F0F1-type ATP synthase epsilon subunit
MAIRADDLDDAKAEAARAAAEKRLKERLGDSDAAAVNAAILRSVEALKGRRRRGK